MTPQQVIIEHLVSIGWEYYESNNSLTLTRVYDTDLSNWVVSSQIASIRLLEDKVELTFHKPKHVVHNIDYGDPNLFDMLPESISEFISLIDIINKSSGNS